MGRIQTYDGDPAPGVVILITNFVFPSLMTLGAEDPLPVGQWIAVVACCCYPLIVSGGMQLSFIRLMIVAH